MSTLLDELSAAERHLKPLLPSFDRAPVGVVLGSGLGAFGDGLEDGVKLPYAEIPHMPRSTVVGHAGNLCAGRAPGSRAPVLCLQGRVHMYEGLGLDRVVFGVRVLARLGCRAVLLTNAAGGIHASYAPGDLMLLTDHINLLGKNPLVGPNEAALGPRFPDLSVAYDARLRELARAAAAATGVPLREGVYAAMVGPSYETPAEIRMLRTLGADAVGMSTVPEVVALRHMGVPVGAVSCITNLAAGLSASLLDHAEVEDTAKRTRGAFVRFLGEWIAAVSRAPEAGRDA